MHFNISRLDAFPWLCGHVSQSAFTGFAITAKSKTGDGNKKCVMETHAVPRCVWPNEAVTGLRGCCYIWSLLQY